MQFATVVVDEVGQVQVEAIEFTGFATVLEEKLGNIGRIAEYMEELIRRG